jgi:two-component system, OmpR family, phosphate regulon sensor histidine kinase PhoR
MQEPDFKMAAKLQRNVITIGLMATSLTLLILLQIFWLRSSYEDARSDLARESNMIFQSAVFGMWDSLMANSIQPLIIDSLTRGNGSFHKMADSVLTIATVENNIVRRGSKRDTASFKIILSTGDSTVTDDVLRPLAERITRTKKEKGANQTFIIRMNSDTLDVDKLTERIKNTFVLNGIDAEFSVAVNRHRRFSPSVDLPPIHRGMILRRTEIDYSKPLTTNSDEVSLDPVSVGPRTDYSGRLENIRPYLIGQIKSEIFFSIILTLLTASAFFLMYRNFREQQRLVSAKNEFINNVTHELKTPVATVSVALEALQNFNASQDSKLTKEYLEIAQRELVRLNEITDRILKTSILENDVTITKETSDLDHVITSVLADMKIIFEQKNANVSYRKDGADFPLHCDSYKLYQMIENLIDNALKYSNGTPLIEISLTGSNNQVLLIVKDNGIGIRKEYQEKIFDKFFRVPTGDIHTIKGYGLGLSYVSNLVRSLAGSINVESELSKGSTFTLSFPRIRVRELSIKVGGR